jgi:hypothetical protein
VAANFDSQTDVALNLARAWEFLSGERGMFDVWCERVPHPDFAEFSVFMPLAVKAESRTAGVGVLIQRDDATIVASHMFGLPEEDVTDDDLRDACAEVCNVFSGCISSQVSPVHPVGIGLPKMATSLDFQEISKGSVLTLTYRFGQQIKEISVLVYGVFNAPVAMR